MQKNEEAIFSPGLFVKWRKDTKNALIGRSSNLTSSWLTRALYALSLLFQTRKELISKEIEKGPDSYLLQLSYLKLLQSLFAIEALSLVSKKEGGLVSYLYQWAVRSAGRSFLHFFELFASACKQGAFLQKKDQGVLLSVMSHDWSKFAQVPLHEPWLVSYQVALWAKIENSWLSLKELHPAHKEHREFWMQESRYESVWMQYKKSWEQEDQESQGSLLTKDRLRRGKIEVSAMLLLLLAALYPHIYDASECRSAKSLYPCSLLKKHPVLDQMESVLQRCLFLQTSGKELVEEVRQDLCLLKDLYAPFPGSMCRELLTAPEGILEGKEEVFTELIHCLHCLLSSVNQGVS